MVKIPSGITVTISQERKGVVGSKGASQDSSKNDDNNGNKRSSISFRGLTVPMSMNVTMHEPGTKTYE